MYHILPCGKLPCHVVSLGNHAGSLERCHIGDGDGKVWVPGGDNIGTRWINPFWRTGPRALDAIATSDPSMTREVQGGCRHGVSGDQAVQRDHTALP